MSWSNSLCNVFWTLHWAVSTKALLCPEVHAHLCQDGHILGDRKKDQKGAQRKTGLVCSGSFNVQKLTSFAMSETMLKEKYAICSCIYMVKVSFLHQPIFVIYMSLYLLNTSTMVLAAWREWHPTYSTVKPLLTKPVARVPMHMPSPYHHWSPFIVCSYCKMHKQAC